MTSLRYLMICLLILLPASAWAQTWLDSDRFTFSGFGTFGVMHNNIDEADFVRDIGQPKGASKGWSARTDSLLGAQLGMRLEDNLDVMIQGISRYHDSGDFSPELSWAFVRWNPDPGLQLRAGRLGWDVYLLSDSRYVGYTYPWVRPPVDHFGTLQLTYIDGADVTFRYPLGSDLALLKLYAGRSRSQIFLGKELYADFAVDRVYGGHFDYETGPWRFRLGYTEVESNTDFRGDVADTIEQYYFLDANKMLGEVFGFDRLKLYSVGATFDRGPVQLQAMWDTSTTSSDGRIDSGFVSAGYRIGRMTPFVMYSQVETSSKESSSENNFKQSTWSVGTRYDMTTQIAFKTQVDRIHIERPGFLWRNVDPDWNGGWATMVSLGLDFVF